MAKRIQNRVAESRATLPVTALLATVVWLVAGLAQGRLLIEFACFVVTTYLMVELNNGNALIRIYSRTVSCAFLLISCAACFTFSSEQGAIAELCIVAAFYTLFHTYQDNRSSGWTFYTFLAIGLASMVYVHIIYFVPVIWVLMASRLRSMSLRTFTASLLGLITPYWFGALYLFYEGEITTAVDHLRPLWEFGPLAGIGQLTPGEIITFCVTVVLAATGTIHYLRTSYNDKIRIRMFYDCFIVMTVCTIVFTILQPSHFDMLMRMMIISTSPLIAHFVALTRTRITNIAFLVIVAALFLLTGYNLWQLFLNS